MIAIPIVARNINEAIEQIERANELGDLIELRFDCFDSLSEKDVERAIKKCKRPVIATCRSRDEGGFCKGTDSKRMAVLKKAMQLGADFIDIEFGTPAKQREKLFDARKKYKGKIIISKHFFGYTPPFEELKKLFMKMKKLKPDVIKIVTKANSHDDNKIVFLLLKEAKKHNQKIISFCMGDIGRDSRILALPLGSMATFASLQAGKESADGQIPVEELKKIYTGLRVLM